VRPDQSFKGRQFTAEVILWAVRWYLMFPISYRDLELMLADRGVNVDHTTIFRWIQAYAPEIEKRIRPHLRPSNGSWRVDETYVRVKGRWMYLYRAVDSRGQTIDFLLSAKRDAEAAKRFFRKALGQPHTVNPRTITVDKNPAYPCAVEQMKRTASCGDARGCGMQVPQQHRGTRPPARETPGQTGARLRQFPYGATNTGGYEAMAMIRKGQVRGIGGTRHAAQATFVAELLRVAA
jgi:transposase-like protein